MREIIILKKYCVRTKFKNDDNTHDSPWNVIKCFRAMIVLEKKIQGLSQKFPDKLKIKRTKNVLGKVDSFYSK